MKGTNMTKKKPQTDFKPIGVKDLTDILGITIKKDEANKVVTFLCQLSAYTENAQFNVSYNAPSSTGKSYIPTEIASLLPWNGWRRFGPSVPLGGEGGVRTHDTFRYTRFPSVLFQPLTHLSIIYLPAARGGR